jgi:hypothetical protein
MGHGFNFSLSPNSLYACAEFLNMHNSLRPVDPSVSRAKTFLVLTETNLDIFSVPGVKASILTQNHIHVVSQFNFDGYMNATAKNTFYQLFPTLAS